MQRKKATKKGSVPSSNHTQQQIELWHRHVKCLSRENKEIIERATAEARAAGGSRLAAALHLLVVRRILCGDATNAKQKKLWSAYLVANLPGFVISRAQVYRDIAAADAAVVSFPSVFLDEFINGGYALNVRPTVEEPLGKFTEPCKQILSKLEPEHLSDKECAAVLSEASAIIQAEAKRNRAPKPALTADEKHDRILKDFHNSAVRYFEDLAEAVLPGQSYSVRDVQDDLEAFLSHFMTAAGLDLLEFEPRCLPEGYERLSLPGSASDSSDTATGEATLAATAA